MTNHDTILQDAARTAQQMQHGTRAGSHRGSPSARRGVPEVVIDVLASSGEPMEESVRREMEAKLGADFSDARVHTGPKAAAAASSVHARAFTYGKHIVFNRGEYRPETVEGRKLLVHELVHIVQQTGDGTNPKIRSIDDHLSPRVVSRDNLAEREAERIAERVVSSGNTDSDRPAGDANLIFSSEGSREVNVFGATDRSMSRESESRKPMVRVCRSIQRYLTDDARKALWSDVAEVPRDNKEKPDWADQLSDKKAYVMHLSEDSWKIAAPANGPIKVYKVPSHIKVITHEKAKKKYRSHKKVWWSHPKGSIFSQTPWDKAKNITVKDKREALFSGKPAGTKVGEGQRTIRGPVERNVLAATMALHPIFNNDKLNTDFHGTHMSRALSAAWKTEREIAQYFINNSRKIKSPGSVKGWSDSLLTGYPNVENQLFMIITKSVGWSKNKIKKEMESQDYISSININNLNKLSETEAAQLLAGLLTTPSLTKNIQGEYDFPKFLGPFIRVNLDNTVRLLQQQRISTNQRSGIAFKPNTVEDFISSVGGDIAPVLKKQTLINMGKEVARAIQEMGLAAIQFVLEKNTTWKKANFSDSDLKDEFSHICTEKQVFLLDYLTILRGIKKYQKKEQENLETVIDTVFSASTAGVSAAIGAATAGLSLVVQGLLAAGVALVGKTLPSLVKTYMTGSTFDPKGLYGDWVASINTQIVPQVKEELRKMINTNQKTKNGPVDNLSSAMRDPLQSKLGSYK